MTLSDWLAQASLVLAVLALILAGLQALETRQQTKRLQKQSEDLITITESLSTRYLGPFPEYLSVVTDVITGAKNEINILNGNPAPAYFTAPNVWLDYSQALERKARAGLTIQLICMADGLRRQRLEQQFPTVQGDWDNWIIDNQERARDFLRFKYSDMSFEDLNYGKLLDLLQATQRDILRDSFKGMQVFEVNQIVSVQVWIADRTRAVFSIQTLRTNAVSHGLYTSDPLFVNALYSMIEIYKHP